MMPRADSKENKSLRTFFFYFGIVFFFVVISLGIKAFTLLQESRFDREHQFILFLAEGEIVKQIAIFTPVDRKVSVVTLQGVKVTQSTAPRILGVLPDGFVSTKFPLNDLNIPEIIQKIGFSLHSVKTNLTIFDIANLGLAAQRVKGGQTNEKLAVTKERETVDSEVKNLFINDTIFSENTSIQIINASKVPGLGSQLERSLKHLGCNIVAVSSSRKQEQLSKIRYFGKKSYTLEKLEKLLDFTLEETNEKMIADITIVIGNDMRDTRAF